MNLIHGCINNDPQLRPHASEIIGQLTELVLQYPISFANRLEMLRHNEIQEEEKRALREEGERKDRMIQQNEDQISTCREELRALREERETEIQQTEQQISSLRERAQQKADEIDQLNVVHSSEVEQLKLQVRDLNSQNLLLVGTNEAEVTELKAKAVIYEAQLKNLQEESERFESQIAKQREESETQLAKEREVSGRMRTENHNLQSNVNTLQCTNSTLEADILRKDAVFKRNESELEVKTRVLQEKDAIISGMSEQLTRARECLATKQQVSTVN